MTLPDLGDPDTYQDGFPHALFARLRRESPVVWCPEPATDGFDGGPGLWAVTRHADVVAAGKRTEVFSSHEGGTFIRDSSPRELRDMRRAMLNTDPPEHSKLRRIVSKAFTPRVVAGMSESITRHARDVVDKLGDGGDLDFVEHVSAEMPLLVLADILGVPPGDRHLLYDWTNRMVGFGDPQIGDPKSYVSAFIELFAYAAELTKRKRAHPTDDVWSLAVNAEVDGERLSDDDLDRFFQLLVIAGNETTRNLFNGTILTLSQHPDQWRRLRADPGLLPTAIEEILRYFPPVTQFRRTAVQDIELGGQRIRAGDKVVLCYASANRDEDVFTEPDRFDITRTENPHVSFGAGPHFCLGNAVARLEARALLPILFDRFPTIEVIGEPVRARSNFINGISELPVRLSTAVGALA
ncbi:cytochrome P450 [Amycolatopsis azurea]|uniref:Cytochrome P450 n=1 Tax=Amycolatopsis azurea DSM 43854 TaxID=1238180 RepID=M2QAH1_9PSEU|nr:cytochrome P450 [Amycolatopsis azurea]EMD23741.1 putative cytochrome P450 hydroxylase [Amycolatopsis azurea DSM 43854]OOC02933.1 cytochrome P450 [Amycolatopsis azurea DSM 43854]